MRGVITIKDGNITALCDNGEMELKFCYSNAMKDSSAECLYAKREMLCRNC
jgi:hypothetical protein